MADILTPDICVIGGGSGGLSVAAAAAAFGVSVVLIEKGRMGGECLNTGCVPSKALLAAARRAEFARTGQSFGVNASPSVNFAQVRRHVRGVIAAIAPNDSAARFRGLGVNVIESQARFIDPRTVEAGGYRIRARRFVIATGAKPAVPAIEGLNQVRHETNETIFDLAELPKHLLVVGAGPIGLELAQAFRRLGSAVTVMEAATPLSKDDPECAAIVLDALTREGVAIRSGVKVKQARRDGDGVALVIAGEAGDETIAGSHLLIAAGRQPTVDGLNLEAGGIAYQRSGITVDRRLRASNRRIFAIGDVTGQAPFTHAANYHAGIVIQNTLFRLPAKADPSAIPWVTYTDPELAQTGLTEAQARARGYALRILRWPYHDNDRAQAERRTLGHIKVITDKRGRILGATIAGAEAGELITTWTLAIARRMNVRALTGIVMPYPTLSEVGKRAAIDFYTPGLTNPWLRRIIAMLRVFG